MKLLLKNATGLFLLTFAFSCAQNSKAFKENNDLEYVKSELKNALLKNEILPNKVIYDSQTAIDVAEIILFKIYGEKKIITQRPYNINLINEYYIINGTLPKNMKGGTFLMIINSKDGKVIKLTHGR